MMYTQAYAPTAINPLNARELIENAYKQAGIPPKNSIDAITQMLYDAPTAYEVAVEYSKRALDGEQHGKPKDVLAEAIEAVAKAQASNHFREIYLRASEALAIEKMDDTRDAAVADLEKAFARTVKELRTAAKRLDPKEPFDKDRVFDLDASAEYKTVRGALAELAAYSIVAVPPVSDVSSATMRALSIVTVPAILTPAPAHRNHMHGAIRVPDNATQERRTIERFIRDADHNMDKALFQVAIDHYEGLRFELATVAEVERRRTSVLNATTVTIL